MPERPGWGPREHLLSSLALPTRTELAFRRYGYDTVEKLMGSDPFFDVYPIGPSSDWIEEVECNKNHQYPGHKHYYRRELDLPNKQQGYRWPKPPWIEIRGIGITSVLQTLEAIALWQEENAKEARYARVDCG